MNLVTLPSIGKRNISLEFSAFCDMTIHPAFRPVTAFTAAYLNKQLYFMRFLLACTPGCAFSKIYYQLLYKATVSYRSGGNFLS
jgi:hypothetical protein